MTYFLLGLGSNIEPQTHLPAAVTALDELGNVVERSPAIFTEPVGETFNQVFGNQLVVFQSDLPAPMLKQKLQRLEEHMGREPKSPARKTRDRTIDIDILTESEAHASLRAYVPEESYYAQVNAQWRQEENV